MASLEEHCRDCERLLGNKCEEVNIWIDQAFQVYGGRHRFVKHHDAGINKAEELFGELGRKAAIVHILKDCGHIPTEAQWAVQEVDILGMDPNSEFNGFWDPKDFDYNAESILYLDGLKAEMRAKSRINEVEKYKAK